MSSGSKRASLAHNSPSLERLGSETGKGTGNPSPNPYVSLESPEKRQKTAATATAAALTPVTATAAMPTGSVWVCGSGDCGQLALGEDVLSCTRFRRHPFFESEGHAAVALAAGGLHTLALTRDGQVYAWGCNDERALGHGAEEFEVARVEGLVNSQTGQDEQIIQVACGDSISAALTAEGRIYTWGTFRDSKGLLGVAAGSNASLASNVRSPSPLSTASTSTVSDYHERPTPLQAMAHLRVHKLAAGANHLLALTDEGEVYAWGSGEQGQLGRRVLERHKLRALLPTRITPRRHRSHGGIIGLFCGAYHSFLLARDGTVFAVGLNNFGQLGLGDYSDRLAAEEIPSETWQGHRIVSLAAGEHHSLALSATGRVFAFGRADSGQLGLGNLGEDSEIQSSTGSSRSKKAFPLPVLVPDLAHVTKIAAGSNHNLVIASTSADEIFSWGYGEMGQLGHGQDEDEAQPRCIAWKQTTATDGSFKVLDISAGGQHSVVLTRR
jgi:regulator of chromosome condensation